MVPPEKVDSFCSGTDPQTIGIINAVSNEESYNI
jgi:hypothetical protein